MRPQALPKPGCCLGLGDSLRRGHLAKLGGRDRWCAGQAVCRERGRGRGVGELGELGVMMEGRRAGGGGGAVGGAVGGAMRRGGAGGGLICTHPLLLKRGERETSICAPRCLPPRLCQKKIKKTVQKKFAPPKRANFFSDGFAPVCLSSVYGHGGFSNPCVLMCLRKRTHNLFPPALVLYF